MSIELSDEQKDLFNKILEAHDKKKNEKNRALHSFMEAEIASTKNALMQSLGFKKYMALLKETAPLFY